MRRFVSLALCVPGPAQALLTHREAHRPGAAEGEKIRNVNEQD